MTQSIDWDGLWLKDATANVVHREEFPTCIEVFPELLDGSFKQGNATEIFIQFVWKEDGIWVDGIIKDNGMGMRDERRFLSPASSCSLDSTHRNGNGTKFAFTKFIPKQGPDGHWSVLSRKKNRDRSLYSSPFRGPDTKVVDLDDSDSSYDSLLPTGYITRLTFKKERFKNSSHKQLSAKEVFDLLKEKICTTYSEETLRRVFITLECVDGKNIFRETSNPEDGQKMWHSFEYECTIDKDVKKIHSLDVPEKGWSLAWYNIEVDGRESYNLKKNFPVYGKKNLNNQNIFIFQNGRMISVLEFNILFGKKIHGHENGKIIFIHFRFEEQDFEKFPRPASIKNAFWENCEHYQSFLTDLRSNIIKLEKTSEKKETQNSSPSAPVTLPSITPSATSSSTTKKKLVTKPAVENTQKTPVYKSEKKKTSSPETEEEIPPPKVHFEIARTIPAEKRQFGLDMASELTSFFQGGLEEMKTSFLLDWKQRFEEGFDISKKSRIDKKC